MPSVSNFVLCLALAVSTVSWAMPGTPGGQENGAYLGVIVDKVSPETAAAMHVSGGTLIANVDQDGPACQAGLKGGDIVTRFNGKPVTGPEQFAGMIHTNPPGSTVTLTVMRNGHSQDMKVKLGDWKQMAAMPPMPPHLPMSPVGTRPLPPIAADVDFQSFTPMLARSGLLVEPLSPQLCDFFGVPVNQGVLVRSVDKGGPGAAAGLKAGDVIVKVNNETIHDMQDWKRALKAPGSKLVLSIVRDRKSQSLQLIVPASTSRLEGGDWDSFGEEMATMTAEMQVLGPEFEQNARAMASLAQPDQKQIDEIRRQAEAASKSVTPEMKKQAEELRKQAEQMRRDMAKMTPEMERAAREWAERAKPTAKELSDMMRDIEKQMKEMQPGLRQQMEEFQKQWKQQMQEWQKGLQESLPKQR
jgi:membrane-associated protease RseP (regulator of RpoE activity)